MIRLFEILTGIGAVLAVLMLAAVVPAGSAPQQAAGAAIALCLVAIPYCVAAVMQRREMLRRMPRPGTAANMEPLEF